MEKYIFFSPHENHFGTVTFDDHLKLISNYEELILLDKENLIQDTLSIKSKGKGVSYLQSIIRIHDGVFSISTGVSSFLVRLTEDKILLEKSITRSDVNKTARKANYFSLMQEGYYSFKSKKNAYEFHFFNDSHELVYEVEIQKGDTPFSYAPFFPHHTFIREEKLYFNDKGSNKFVEIDFVNDRVKKYQLPEIQNPEEEFNLVFYDHGQDIFLLNQFSLLDSKTHPSRMFDLRINQMDLEKQTFMFLNKFSCPIHQLRAGFFDRSMILMGHFDGSHAFYKIPIEKLHLLNDVD
ncbi:MAG: hypothetical protein LAT68_05465 [Cyclobacteriaceae bacterium]|nr:hypothetical protein [Cyclobacteriaceae bacterium]MCH8515759.1 hypothetical protein [Cyclobacteriaceae bacterium]